MGVLRDRMIEEMKLRNFSLATQQSYVYAVSRLARYHNKAPDQLSKEDIRAFLVHLTVERKLSPNSFEYRYAEGKTERLPQLARELIDEKVDVIVVGGTRVAVMAKKATSTIPIVVAGAGDLVEAGLIKSFMYPAAVTGVARLSADFFDDRLKLLKEIIPKGSQIYALANPTNPGHHRSLKDAELGARSSGLTFQSVNARTASELDSAIARAANGGASALLLITDAMFNSNVARIAELTVKNRLPTIYDRVTLCRSRWAAELRLEPGGLVAARR